MPDTREHDRAVTITTASGQSGWTRTKALLTVSDGQCQLTGNFYLYVRTTAYMLLGTNPP